LLTVTGGGVLAAMLTVTGGAVLEVVVTVVDEDALELFLPLSCTVPGTSSGALVLAGEFSPVAEIGSSEEALVCV
jgi:hypothetical protein